LGQLGIIVDVYEQAVAMVNLDAVISMVIYWFLHKFVRVAKVEHIRDLLSAPFTVLNQLLLPFFEQVPRGELDFLLKLTVNFWNEILAEGSTTQGTILPVFHK
jgi:hypothetical protein